MKNRLIAAIVVALIGAGTLAGCGGSNPGAAATCGQFRSMSSSDKTKVAQALLVQNGETDTPANETIWKASITAFCAFSSADTAVSGVTGN